MDVDDKITVTLIRNRGYIFNADDYLRLRSIHRIIGSLVGPALMCPRNPKVHGLPALLSSIELRLLFEQDLIRIVEASVLSDCPTSVQLYRAFCELSLDEQHEHQLSSKLADSQKVIERILQGKRKKLRAQGASESECAALTESTVLLDIAAQCVFNPDNALRQVPTAMPDEFCVQPLTGAHSNAGITFRNVDDDLRFRVYCDLWQRGKFVTTGDTFGGDFLVYPGDPMLYHASHIVHCLRGPMRVTQLVASGRMSVLANKLCLFAYESPDDAALHYQTMEWEGNATHDESQ